MSKRSCSCKRCIPACNDECAPIVWPYPRGPPGPCGPNTICGCNIVSSGPLEDGHVLSYDETLNAWTNRFPGWATHSLQLFSLVNISSGFIGYVGSGVDSGLINSALILPNRPGRISGVSIKLNHILQAPAPTETCKYQLYLGDGALPEAFTAIGNLKSFTGTDRDTDSFTPVSFVPNARIVLLVDLTDSPAARVTGTIEYRLS